MAELPKSYRKLLVRKQTVDFRAAVNVETVDLCKPGKGEICVKNMYVGVNASDVNLSRGRYHTFKIPHDIGVESIGVVVQVGIGVTNFQIGDAACCLSMSTFSCYSEYMCIPAVEAFKVPEVKPEYIVLLAAGLTASIGIDKAARITKGETVLITAAAGGVGHIAVQWAKAAAECHVIGTCSSDEKVNILKSLGCDRVINYKKEDIGEVLAKEYPKGVDVIWETFGGSVFEVCVKNLAVKGRLIIVGGIKAYKNDASMEVLPTIDVPNLPKLLMFNSLTVQGFFLPHHMEILPEYFEYLMECLKLGKMKFVCDFGKQKQFVGMEGIIDGVEYLQSGKNIGKVIVKLA